MTLKMSSDRPEHPNHKQPQLSRETANPLGLTSVYSPRHCKPVVDIIFIHGLGGRSHYTWSYKKDLALFWPGWLHEEPGLADVRITTYGYDSSIWPALTKNFSCIDDFSQELLARVKVAANELTGEIPFGEVCIIIMYVPFAVLSLNLLPIDPYHHGCPFLGGPGCGASMPLLLYISHPEYSYA